MAGVLTHQGEQVALEALVAKTAGQNVVLRLYTNNITPNDDTVAGDMTEAADYGYEAKTLSGANWVVSGGDPSVMVYGQQTFTFTGALGNVYGYYYTQASSGLMVAGERFSDGPYNILTSGDMIRVTPTITAE